MLRKAIAMACFSLVLGLLAAGMGFGQIKSGTITGRVTDSTGAVIPAATVTVVNEDTKVPATTQTNGTGDYTVPYLQPGNYAVTVTKEGFTTYSQTGIPLGVDITREIDAQLAVGRTATVVEVKGVGAAALQTETSSVGDTVASDSIAALPDINHNPYYFATLQPQVSGRWQIMDNNGPMSFGIGVYAHVDWSAFSMNGSTAFTANITLDGMNIQGTAWNEADVSPNPDSLSEVKTYTNDYDASIGRGQGAVAMVTKSGTDAFHGSVFSRVRNRSLNANSFSNDVQADTLANGNTKTGPYIKPQYNVVYYGGTFGGPIKKDKAFFFASWQGMDHHTQRQDSLNVPMNNQAKGDFSSPEGCLNPFSASAITGTVTSNNLGTCVNVGGVATPLQLFDPFHANFVSSNLYVHPIITGPNGVSDLTQVADPSFTHYTSFYPAANRFPTDQYNSNNYTFVGPEIFTSNTVNSRVDLNVGKHNLYFTGGIEVGRIKTASPWGNETPPFYYAPLGNSGQIPGVVYDHSPYGGVGDTIAISPTLVVDLRIGVNRAHYINDEPRGPAFDHSAFGMPANYVALLPIPTEAPETVSGGPLGQWATLDSAGAQHKNSHETNWDYAGTATKVRNKWTFKFGFDYMDDFTNTPDVFYSGGAIINDGCGGCQYSNAVDQSVSQNATAATSGFGYPGDLMLGAGWWDFTPAQSYLPAYLEQYLGLYSANTWKATSHLTLNLGLRWDFQPAVQERRNAMMSWDPTGTNPICSNTAIDPTGFGCQGNYWLPGVGGHSRRLWQTEYNNFAPRVGFAYRWHENTVIRGGYGISYLPANVAFNFGNGDYDEWPWGVGTLQNSQGPSPAGVQVYSMENPNASLIAQPQRSNAAPQTYGLGSQTIIPHNYQNAYMQQYNLIVERKVGGWLLSAGFTGARGSRLPVEYFLNGENSSLFNAPSVGGSNMISCFHAGLNCAATDSTLSGAGFLQTGVDPYTGQVPNPFNPNGNLPFLGGYIAKTIARGLYDGPFPLFGYTGTSSGAEPQVNAASSTYNSLQVEAKHQFGHGLMADIFYTWSKSESNSYFQAEHNQAGDTESGSNSGFQWNQTNQKFNRRLDLDDVPSRFVANIVYQLPFGVGHSMNPGNKVASYLASGWRIGGTEMDESGYPLDITDVASGALDFRPNRVPGEPLLVPKNLQKWYNGSTKVTLPDGRVYVPANFSFLRFNPDAFSEPVIPNPVSAGKYLADTYWLGNSAINYSNVRTPSINNLNLSITRDFKLTERFTLAFQCNMTNALNHPNIQTYGTDLGGGELVPPGTGSNGTTNIPLGYSTSSSYGTHGLGTFDFRQIEFQATLRF